MSAIVNALTDPPNWWTAAYRLLVLLVVSAVFLRQTHTQQLAGLAATSCQQAAEVAGAQATRPPGP